MFTCICIASKVTIIQVASTGPVLGRCWQHLPSTSPVLAQSFRQYLENIVLAGAQNDLVLNI